MDDELEALDELAACEPSNVSAIHDGLISPEHPKQIAAAIKHHDTPAARRLRRKLADWEQAIRKLQRTTHELDAAERDVITTAADLAAEIRNDGGSR